jgi:hypothetical protein
MLIFIGDYYVFLYMSRKTNFGDTSYTHNPSQTENALNHCLQILNDLNNQVYNDSLETRFKTINSHLSEANRLFTLSFTSDDVPRQEIDRQIKLAVNDIKSVKEKSDVFASESKSQSRIYKWGIEKNNINVELFNDMDDYLLAVSDSLMSNKNTRQNRNEEHL